MTSVARTFIVDPTPDVVVDYLKDFGHAEEWDPGTQTCTRTDAGTIAIGSQWHNVSKLLGVTTELTYTLRDLAADKLIFVGENDRATSVDTITVRSVGAGSEITYVADLTMHGLAKLATPVMKLESEKLADETEKQLTTVLNRLS